jgi:uncharacterized protein with NAD-binding domain and iron-sulfur cluster
VYESSDRPGGFFRSSRTHEDNIPTEYSWHGMGPWYHNAFDIMKQIPLKESGSIYDLALSRPIDFGIFPNDDKAQFYDKKLLSIHKMFRMNKFELIKWSYLMLKTWTSNNRSKIKYAKMNAAEAWKPLQPKWVTTTNTQAYLPSQKTSVLNLFLAGAHTNTQAQVWSIEGAVESGRRAAKAIDRRVKVIDQYRPLWIKSLSIIDDLLYSIKAPQLIDSIFLGAIFFLVLTFWS